MFFSTLITSFVKILASTPIGSAFDSLLLWIDRGVYRLVQTSFTLFMIMCQLNLNVIYDMAVSLIDRLKALIIVFIIFKVGVALIQYMLDPDKAAKGSKKFLLNILICAAMLVSYNFVFSVFNELSMMILGKPESYKYTTLAQIANVGNEADEGLIFRLFFGTNNNATAFKNVESIGNNMAFNALCATFPDKDKNGLQCTGLIQSISDGSSTSNYNLKKLGNIAKKLDVTVDGHPGIALLLGLYMVYSVIKASVEIGTRMFKLMLLQLVAPIAIITVASDEGVKSKAFTEFYKMYISVFLSAFTRIAAVLLVTVFVSKVFTQVDTLISDNTASTSGYGLWIIIICIVAGYKFAGDIPKMLDKIFTTHLGEDPDKGFGKFLSTVLAAPALGLVGGLAGGLSAIGTGSWGGAIVGGLSGGIGGFASAFKGNTVADKLKAAQESRKKTRARTADIGDAGGVFPWIYGGMLAPTKGAQDAAVSRIDKQIAAYDEAVKIAEDYDKAQIAAIQGTKVKDAVASNPALSAKLASYKGYGDLKFGDNKDAFAATMAEYDENYVAAKAHRMTVEKTGDKDAIAAAIAAERAALDTAKNTAGDAFDDYKNLQHNELTEQKAKEFEVVTADLTFDGKKQSLSLSDKDDEANNKYTFKTFKNKVAYNEKVRLDAEKSERLSRKSYRATHRKKDSGK